MKDVINDIYTRLISFFQSDEAPEDAKDIAYNRLKLVLMQDRMKLDPVSMENLRKDILDVISKYVEIEKDALDLSLAGEGDSMALMFNIPVIRAKTLEEIEKTIESQSNENNIETAQSIENESEDNIENPDSIDENVENETSKETNNTDNDKVL